MPRHARQLSESGVYHVMLRGVNRDAIFLEDEDRERFLNALRLTKEASGCVVLAYCLMTNHVHLVLQTPGEPISVVMKRLGVRYVGWFNRKYSRVGHLFQSRFASLAVEDDGYLITLLRYVWNNPVEAGLVERQEDYRWGSRNPVRSDSRLVDTAVLHRLVPADVLTGTAVRADPVPMVEAARTGRPSLYTDDEAAELIRRCSGADSPDDFNALNTATQQRTIRELRTRYVPFAQIARIIGWTVSRVWRYQVAGSPK